MTNLILCGGVGSRLWPLSRTHLPKQFARLLPGDTLFEATVKRNQGLANQVLIASNRDQSFLAANQLRGLGISSWKSVIEPVGRNTAPAIALACLSLGPGELVLVSPSDHVIQDTIAYKKAVEQAMALAVQGRLVTFGIKPGYPETGFGYIQVDPTRPHGVQAFKEKPDEPTAKSYVASGDYYWNSGMFCFTAGAFLAELAVHAPKVYAAVSQAYQNALNKNPLEPSKVDMEAIPSISIDYAVLEKSEKVACVTCSIGWSDLGSFDALYDYLMESQGNALSCQEAPVLINAQNNLVINGERTVVLIDVEDLIVVESHDALLIARRGSSQRVKEVVDVLKTQRPSLTETFPRAERSWGNYAVLHEEKGHRVKRIEVAPGERLTLQRHQHREEHWTCVSGTAVVQIEQSRKHLDPGQSIMIPQGSAHRLENPGTVPVVIIETQLGSYLGEDDIERIQGE